jgi:hypothetical protein
MLYEELVLITLAEYAVNDNDNVFYFSSCQGNSRLNRSLRPSELFFCDRSLIIKHI